MNKGNRVTVAQLPAAVYDFLTTAFQLWVFPLHRGKIKISRTGTRIHGGSGTTTETNLHRRATKANKLKADANFTFFNMFATNITHTTSQHNGLMVAPHLITIDTGYFGFVGTEITI